MQNKTGIAFTNTKNKKKYRSILIIEFQTLSRDFNTLVSVFIFAKSYFSSPTITPETLHELKLDPSSLPWAITTCTLCLPSEMLFSGIK